MGKTAKEIYEEKLAQGRHYPTDYVNVSDFIKESSYLLYEFKDSTEEIPFDTDTYDVIIKEKSPLFYDRVIDNKSNQELLDLLTEEVPFYYLTPSIYTNIEDTMLSDSRDIGVNNVPSILQESSFYETWFRDAFGYVQNLIILDIYNKLRYPYINENQYLDAKIFSKLAKTAFDESNDAESRIIFKDTEELNNEVYDSSYKYYGEEIGAIDYINDIIEKKIISNYYFIDFSSEQSNFLSNLIDSMYESGQIDYAESYSEKLIFKLQEIKNELLRRKLTGTQTLYKLALTSINRNGSYVGVVKAKDANVETNTSLTSDASANKNRPIRLLNTPGFITQTYNSIGTDVSPIRTFYEIPDEDDKIPLKLLVPIYYTSADIFDLSTTNVTTEFNNEAFYNGGYTDPQDCTEYRTIKSNYQNYLLRDNANFMQFDALEGIISQDSMTQYHNTLDQLTKNDQDELVWRTLDSTVEDESGNLVPYTLDMTTSVANLETIYANALDVNADHIMYHVNSIQQKLGAYYDYLTYPIADGNGVCLMDTFWLNYVNYQLENKTKVNDNSLLGTQISTYVDLSSTGRQASYEFFGVSYADDEDINTIKSYGSFSDPSTIKYVLLWYCSIIYDTSKMIIVDEKKTLITRVTLKSEAPISFYDNVLASEQNNLKLKSEYSDCEIFTKYNVGVLPFTYKDFVNDKVGDIKLGFYSEGGLDTFYDDAKVQGYAKSMFVFSRYDLTKLAKGKDIDPVEISEKDSVFTNSLCDDIKTIYYVVKKTRKIERQNSTSKSQVPKYNEEDSIVESKMIDYFVWSDPIRVVELNASFNLSNDNIRNENIHFSPDWEGLSYYLNTYLNFTEKSASPLRHNQAYKAYDNVLFEVPTVKPEGYAGTVPDYLSLKEILNPATGVVYFVTKQNAYYIYDSHDGEWTIYSNRETLEGPSNNTALSNLTRMRRLDFASNDSGESRPTHWVDTKYSPVCEVGTYHKAREVYGLYLDKIQEKNIDKRNAISIVSDIYGDNRYSDAFDIECSNIEYLTKMPSEDKAQENTLYILTEGQVSTKYIFIREDALSGQFIKVTDDDLALRSSIYYGNLVNAPCISIQDSHIFNPNSKEDTVSCKNYYKISPTSDENIIRQKIYVDDVSDIPNYSDLTDNEKEAFFVTDNGEYYLYIDGFINQIENIDYNSVNKVEYNKAKKYWYWNYPSVDGLTVCFNLDVFGDKFYEPFVGIYSKDTTYYAKDAYGRFYRKRPTDYPAEIGQAELYAPKFVVATSDDEGPFYIKKNDVGSVPSSYGTYYFEQIEEFDPNNSWKKTDEYVRLGYASDDQTLRNATYNRKCEYYEKLGDTYNKVVINNYYYGTFVAELKKELFLITVNDDNIHRLTPSQYGQVIPKGFIYIYENDNWVLCGNDADPESYRNKYTQGTVYYEMPEDTVVSPMINDQLSSELSYYEKDYIIVDEASVKAYPDEENSPVKFFYRKDSETDEYVPCINERVVGNVTYYVYKDTDYVEYPLDPVEYPVNSLLPNYYISSNNTYSLATGNFDSQTTYYTFVGYKKYNPFSMYGNISSESDGYFISTNTSSTQTLISRKSSEPGLINAEFEVNIEQVTGENACNIVLYFYPTGNSSIYWTCYSDRIDVDDFSKKNYRISSSIYTVPDIISVDSSEVSVNKVTMSIVIDNKVKTDVFYIASTGESYTEDETGAFVRDATHSLPTGEYTNLGLPVKYVVEETAEYDDSNTLGDINLFSTISGDSQVNNFYGNVYDFRLYNRGKSTEELLLLNMGTMRELYSYSPSIYKLAYSLYNDLGYLRIVDNSEDNLEDKKIGSIRVFSRSVWDSIYVDNFPVSEEEMDPSSPQYYENYRNPRYDYDVYHYNIDDGQISYYLNDCIEQTLLDRLEVFNGRELEQSTTLRYGNNDYILNTTDKLSAVFSMLMPINYDNEKIDSGKLGFELRGDTIISDTSSDYDKIIIPLKADSSDDYFRYSSDIIPNFLINSDFNLSQWLSRGSNISLVYDKNVDDSYVALADDTKRDGMLNNILVPLVIPKQPKEAYNTVGYLDRFNISDFRLNESLIKLLRATTYYSELRIPRPCKKLVSEYSQIEVTEDMIGQLVQTYFVKDSENNYVLASGTFEPDVVYYNEISGSYVVTTDYFVGNPIINTYSQDASGYVPQTGTYNRTTDYFVNVNVYEPSFYNKWDGLRVLKEGTYYTTCKYPIRLLPFNDEEFDSSLKYNYSTVYGSVRFKIEVSSKPKGMSADEVEKYSISGIPLKYRSPNIVSTLKNPSELISPEDNRTFPHREVFIKLYCLDTPVNDIAGLMKKDGEDYKEQYNFKWTLIGSNDFSDCFVTSWTHPSSIEEGHNYFIKTGDDTYELIDDPVDPSLCYEVNYVSNGITFMDKETLNNGCIIKKDVPMFLSKNYSLPFFIAGQEKTEDDEHFVIRSTSADDDLIEPIRIRPNFNKFNSTVTVDIDNSPISNEDEKITASSVDDLDKIIIVAGKSYKILFDYTSKVSELAFSKEKFTSQQISSDEKTEYARYYSLIDSLGTIDSEYEYIADGCSYNVPSNYSDFGLGFDVKDTFVEETVTVGMPILDVDKTHYVLKNNKYEVATKEFKKDVSYFRRESSWQEAGIHEGDTSTYYYGDPDKKLSTDNALIGWAKNSSEQSVNNIINSYKIKYLTHIEDDMRDSYDVENTSYPSLSSEIEDFKAYSLSYDVVESVDGFSEADILKTLYTNLVNNDLIYKMQSSSSGLIGGFTKVSPNITYRTVGNILDVSLLAKRNVEIYPDTHELYSYTASSRVMPFNNTFNITRTSLFKNNLLKGKQLDYLNTKYWSLTGTYGDAVIVEDDNFGKNVLEVSNLDSLDMMYDGGEYVLNAKYETAINVKDTGSNIREIKVYFYDIKNNLLNEDGYILTKTVTDAESGLYNYHYDTSDSLSACKIKFNIKTTSTSTIRIGKIIVRGNSTTSVINGLSNCYYNNTFGEENVILMSHIVPVLKDLETEQYIPIQFKNGKINAYSQVRPNPGLNIASSFISKNVLAGYGNKSKISKLNKPWIRRLYYDHGGGQMSDSLTNSAYFHKYDIVADSLNVKKTEETFSNVNDIFMFTPNSDGTVESSKCFLCSRADDNSALVLTVGNYDMNEGKYFGIDLNLDSDNTLSYFGNNMQINTESPISVSDERLSMTYNCFNLENYRANVSSPTVVTNIQLLGNESSEGAGTLDNKEVIYEFEYLPIIYDELKHHISFNILIKR